MDDRMSKDIYMYHPGPGLGCQASDLALGICLCALFTLAVFGENQRYCYSLGIVVVIVVQKLTFCNISVFIEDIYLKLGICVHCPKSNPYY